MHNRIRKRKAQIVNPVPATYSFAIGMVWTGVVAFRCYEQRLYYQMEGTKIMHQSYDKRYEGGVFLIINQEKSLQFMQHASSDLDTTELSSYIFNIFDFQLIRSWCYRVSNLDGNVLQLEISTSTCLLSIQRRFMGLSQTRKESKATQGFHEEVEFVSREATTFRRVTCHEIVSASYFFPSKKEINNSNFGRIQEKK